MKSTSKIISIGAGVLAKVLLLVLPLALRADDGSTNQATRAETEAWICKEINQMSYEILDVNHHHVESGHGSEALFEWNGRDNTNANGGVQLQYTERTLSYDFSAETNLYVIQLKDLDPAKVESQRGDNSSTVILKIANGRPAAFRKRSSDRPSVEEYGRVITLRWRDPAMGERVAKAFRHEIELCGGAPGRPDKKEPF